MKRAGRTRWGLQLPRQKLNWRLRGERMKSQPSCWKSTSTWSTQHGWPSSSSAGTEQTFLARLLCRLWRWCCCSSSRRARAMNLLGRVRSSSMNLWRMYSVLSTRTSWLVMFWRRKRGEARERRSMRCLIIRQTGRDHRLTQFYTQRRRTDTPHSS